MSTRNVLVYLVRKDLRASDNPILHHLASFKDHGFTHLLPVYIFPAHHLEISGFIQDSSQASPYPEARSDFSGYWRCGPYRAKFIAQAVWDLKGILEGVNSGLALRFGSFKDVVGSLLDGLKKRGDSGAVWMVGEEGLDEIRDEKAVSSVCEAQGFQFQRWTDEKYFIDDRDLNFKEASELPGIFTDYRKSMEPLREKPRAPLPRPQAGSLPTFPAADTIEPQPSPFIVPDLYEDLEERLLRPVKDSFSDVPPHADDAVNAHPFKGGETMAHERLQHIITSGLLKDYRTSRNGLIGADFSTKLSAYLSQGCLTARQIHEALAGYEDGKAMELETVEGFGQGENTNTKSVREELMWRDYMRLYARKVKSKLYSVEGPRGGLTYAATETNQSTTDGDSGSASSPTTAPPKVVWKVADTSKANPHQSPSAEEVAEQLERFKAGTTGLGLIDASMRELLHTGYTSNRARQNAANFLAKHLGIDWRYGAEWYEMLLVDYDVCSNWANWQYVAGVGNDPRGEARIFNPVKQAFDYDREGAYVRMWVPELAPLATKLENLFQASTASREELEEAGLADNIMATNPVKRIHFNPNGKPPSKRPWKKKMSNASVDADGNGGGSGNAGGGRGGRGSSWRGGQVYQQMGGRGPGGGYRGYPTPGYGMGPQVGRGGGWPRHGPSPGRGGGGGPSGYAHRGPPGPGSAYYGPRGGGGYYQQPHGGHMHKQQAYGGPPPWSPQPYPQHYQQQPHDP